MRHDLIMIGAAQTAGTSNPELRVGWLGLLLVCGYGGWLMLRRFTREPPGPEPWDAATAAELESENCTPLCHHCLTPHEPGSNFCVHCGAGVGACANLLPWVYLFSLGHALRIGTGERFKRSPLTVGGYFVLGMVEYGPFAVFYWYRLIKNLSQRQDSPLKEET